MIGNVCWYRSLLGVLCGDLVLLFRDFWVLWCVLWLCAVCALER